jgi:hypothetical protein
MKKILLLTAAVLIFLFFIYTLYRWLEQGHNFKYVWWCITNDWFVAATFFDALVFMTICAVWLLSDMKKRGFTTLKMIFIILALIITGSVTFLVYLAYRKKLPRVKS